MNCCLYDEKKDKIIAFLVEKITINDLNEQLKNKIPEYMLPNKLIVMDSMPLNVNGKIDRVKLKELL